jgi:hypothetical protein
MLAQSVGQRVEEAVGQGHARKGVVFAGIVLNSHPVREKAGAARTETVDILGN